MQDFWNERYAKEGFSYGKEPNEFLKLRLRGLSAGKVLFPAEGEGRNAVYAASLGWNAWAFDYSSSGRKKAMSLASERSVDLVYENFSYQELPNDWRDFDLIALIYAHMPDQIGRSSGGSQNESLLYTPEKLSSDFSALTEELCETQVVHLAEGQYHKGEAAVIRYIGQKA